MSRGEPAERGGAPEFVRRFGPWLVAFLALLWVSRSVRWDEVWGAFQGVSLPGFLLASVVLIIVNCAVDTLAMYYTFGWFGCRLPYRELYVIRAATYLLAVVQYYVGQAAVIGFLRQRKGVPLWQGAGWILFISGINMGVLVLLSTTGLIKAEVSLLWLRWVPIGVGAGALVYAIVLWQRPARLARLAMLAPMFEMGVLGHVKATVVRLPHILVLVLWHFIALRWFGVAVPPLVALAYLPAVFFFAALPVSVQGLGLSQWAAVTFFAGYATRGASAVLAYSLATTGASILVQVAMGVLFLRPAQRLGLQQESITLEQAEPAVEMTAG
jgi:hypothetical protein